MPNVSIIVPMYNVEKFLDKCIKSIINQTYEDFEIILIDDGSTDNSYKIAKKYADKDGRIRLIQQANKGLVETRNIGISLAKGKWIGFVDSDDWISPKMYEELVTCMEKYNCDLVSSDLIRVVDGKDSYMLCDNYPRGLYKDEDIVEKIYPTMLHDYDISEKAFRCYLVSKLFRKEILEPLNNEMDSRVFYGEDAMRFYRYILKCKSVYFTRKPLYYYNCFSNSLSFVYDEKLILSNYFLFQNLYRAFKESTVPETLIRQLKQNIILLEQRVWINVFHLDRLNLVHWVFDCFHEYYDKKFVIYGAGAGGQALYRELFIRNKLKGLIAWVDRNPRDEGNIYQVKPVSEILNLSYDVILVALKNRITAESVKKELIETYHIDESKVIVGEIYYYDELMNAYR